MLPTQSLARKWLFPLLLFIVSALILFFASLQYFWPGKWWENHEALGWKGESLVLVKGQGSGAHGKLMINGLAESGVALASLPPSTFRAENYPIVHWSISGAKPDAKVEFVWRTEENPGRVFARQLEWADNAVVPLHMEGDTHWRGQIIGLALMAHVPLDAPLVIEAVKLEPFAPLRIVWREWFGAVPWLGTSVNFMGSNEPRQWLAPLPFLAAALGLALLGCGVLAWRKILVPDIRILWVLVFIAWFALDMRWQLDLWHKLGLTQQRYAGKSWEEKHFASIDGRLFDLIQQMKKKLPLTPSRIFLFEVDDYMRNRGAYHLYPLNVLKNYDLFPVEKYKSGDFIIIMGRDDVEFDPAQQLLKWGGQQLSAELLLLAENNVLLRVR